MNIDLLEVEHYRSIRKAVIKPNRFNVFVGQNNHGKTNLFEAIEWHFSGMRKGESVTDICHLKDTTKKPKVAITYSGAQEAVEKMQHPANKTKIKNVLNGAGVVTIGRVGEDKKRTFEVNGKQVDTGTGFDAALNDFLPKLEYVSSRKFYDEVGKYGKSTPVGVMLAGVLETILEKDPSYRAFREKFQQLFQDEGSQIKIELDNIGKRVQIYIEKQFPDCSSVKFKVSEPVFEDLLKNFDTIVHDGVETSASEKGDGMQRALMLAIIQAYADFRKEEEAVGKSFLFLIDEAELHLHPTAQRALKNALIDLSKRGDQVFINTHSSVLVVDDYEYQNLYKVHKENLISNIDRIDSELDKLEVVYNLLGGSPADLLLPYNFLIVEGQSEFHFISRVIKRFYSQEKAIQVVFAAGDYLQAERTLNAIHKVYNPLWLKPIYKDKAVILCDMPKNKAGNDQLEQFKIDYSNLIKEPIKLFVLPKCSLEEYYPKPWKKSAEELQKISGEKEKIRLAKECADKISRDEFESQMPCAFEALKRCWDLAF
jgi:putative ATP-dependent endonuclease of the OLD family